MLIRKPYETLADTVARHAAVVRDAAKAWVAQVTYPEDFFQEDTFTVEQWLAISIDGGSGESGRKSDKWQDLIRACVAVDGAIDISDGFQHDGPRVGWSPLHGTVFIFKSANNGTTCFVTRSGIKGLQDVID